MIAKRLALLVLILAFGGSVEVAHHLRGRLDVGPWGIRVIGGRFLGPSFSFETTSEEAAAPVVEIRNAFGAVRTTESPNGEIRVTLRKVVFLPDEARARALADRIRLVVDRSGSTLFIRTNREDVTREENQAGFETHLEVALPRETRLVVRAEHGAVSASHLLAADIEASFEPVEVEDVLEAVRVKAQHGETTVRRAGAAVEIEARHGGVNAEDVAGMLSVDAEHGDVRAERVGAVHARLSHGDIEARTVAGELMVRGSHAGVEASDITGPADVLTSFDSVTLERVGSDARVVCQHGGVRLASVRGATTVEDKFGGLEIEEAEGPVEFSLEHGDASVKNAARGVKGRVTRGGVSLEGFGGPIDLDVEGGRTQLAPAGILSSAVKVASRRGDIDLVVPRGSRFSLDARAKRGQVEVEGIEGLSVESSRRGGGGTSARGDVGGGGKTVQLETEGGSIRLTPGSSTGE